MPQSTGCHISVAPDTPYQTNSFIDFTSAQNNSLVCAVRLSQSYLNSSLLSVLTAGFKVFLTHLILNSISAHAFGCQ